MKMKAEGRRTFLITGMAGEKAQGAQVQGRGDCSVWLEKGWV